MTRPWEKAEVQVCTDCVLTLANGLPEDLDPGRAEAITDRDHVVGRRQVATRGR